MQQTSAAVRRNIEHVPTSPYSILTFLMGAIRHISACLSYLVKGGVLIQLLQPMKVTCTAFICVLSYFIHVFRLSAPNQKRQCCVIYKWYFIDAYTFPKDNIWIYMLIQTCHGNIASKYERILVMNVKETGNDWKL